MYLSDERVAFVFLCRRARTEHIDNSSLETLCVV